MLQKKLHIAPVAEKVESKNVQLYIQSKLIDLDGHWMWDLKSDAVFCSDVMFLIPSTFEGTRGIIHPDDLPLVTKALDLINQNKPCTLEFRMITTYGEIKKLTGIEIVLRESKIILEPAKELEIEINKNKVLKKELEKLNVQIEVAHYAEKILKAGTWFNNLTTSETWFSDSVFRIHGLAPQSLNAHLNTFFSFIHPDDKDVVVETFSKAYSAHIPIHITYRVITADKKEKWVLLITNWLYNHKGELILNGIIKDKNDAVATDQLLMQTQATLNFQKEFLLQIEENASTACWQINLLTKKSVWSDNFYRILGLKPNSVLPGINLFINYVHPDDREKVLDAYQKMRYEHICPTLEYRILRQDGIRYLKQKGKVITCNEGEIIIAGTLQDITNTRKAEQKINLLHHELSIHKATQQQTENLAGACSWQMDVLTGKFTCSDNLYRFYGLKPQSVVFSKKILLSKIYKEDQKKFTTALDLVIAGQPSNGCTLRVYGKGHVVNLRASFELVQSDENKMVIGTFCDVTQQSKLADQVTTYLQQYNLLKDAIKDKLFITDNNNNIIEFNKACEKDFEWKNEEVVNKNLFDVFPSLKINSFINRLEEALMGETIYLPYTTLPPLKGCHDLKMVPITAYDGQTIGIMHLLHNVEKERELQLGLSMRLNFIESLIDATVDRIIVMDRNMNYLYWNKESEDYYGLKKEHVIGKNILEVFPASKIYDTTYNDFRRALKGEMVHVPAKQSTTDGLYQETYLIPIKNDNNEVTAVVWLVHDLTNEYELIKQQQKAENILNALNEAYVELDADFKILYVNAKAEIFWRKKKEDLLNKQVWEVFPESVGTPLYQAAIKACTEKVTIQGQYISSVTGATVNVSIAPTPDGVLLVYQPCS